MRVCKEHVWEACNCMVMYCTDSICHFCGEKRDGGIHPLLKAKMEHEWIETDE